jgi:hypothetical protein
MTNTRLLAHVTQPMEAVSYDDAMITGFPPSPFVERPVRNVLNLVGAGLGFLSAILGVIASTAGNGGVEAATVGLGLPLMLVLFGSIAVFAGERVGAALVVGGGVNLVAQGIRAVVQYHEAKGGPAISVSGKLVIILAVVAVFAVALSFGALKTRGNPFVAAVGAVGGVLFGVSEIFPGRHLTSTRLMQFAAPIVVVALIMIVTPLLGRVGSLAGLAAAVPFIQGAANNLRNDAGAGGLFRYGVPLALLLVLAAAFVLGLIAADTSQAVFMPAAAPYGYAPMPTAGQPVVAPAGMWAQTVPGVPVLAGTGMAVGAADPWSHPGQESSTAVLATTVVPIAPAVVNVANPARWEADPYGRFEKRYWDGTRWTEHVSTKGSTSVDPVG